jgi:hypothetical protein
MSDLSIHALRAFRLELEKEAVDWHSVAGGAAGLAGLGAGAGAIAGAGLGAAKKYRAARAEGAGVGGALGEGALGALGGVGRGALTGAGIGAGAGAALGHLTPEVVKALPHMPSMAGSAARYGQRQLHAVSGWLPEAGNAKSLETIRGGAYGARQRAGTARRALIERQLQPNPEKLKDYKQVASRAAGAQRGLDAAEKAQEMGLTSVPGFARALGREGIGKTLGTGLREQWHNTPTSMKALTLALPAAQVAQTVTSDDTQKGEHLGRALGGAAAGLTMGAIPITTGMLAQGAVSGAAGRMGRAYDKVRARFRGGDGGIQAPKENTPYSGDHVPTERITTERAQGATPESPT